MTDLTTGHAACPRGATNTDPLVSHVFSLDLRLLPPSHCPYLSSASSLYAACPRAPPSPTSGRPIVSRVLLSLIRLLPPSHYLLPSYILALSISLIYQESREGRKAATKRRSAPTVLPAPDTEHSVEMGEGARLPVESEPV